MSRKNRFKRHREYIAPSNLQEKPKVFQETNKNEYDMKPEFINLGIILLLFVGLLIGLYYYNQQSHMLDTAAKKLFSSF